MKITFQFHFSERKGVLYPLLFSMTESHLLRVLYKRIAFHTNGKGSFYWNVTLKKTSAKIGCPESVLWMCGEGGFEVFFFSHNCKVAILNGFKSTSVTGLLTRRKA
jgi:hypothetical protein